MVILVGNGINDPNSNPGWGCLHLTNSSFLPPTMDK